MKMIMSFKPSLIGRGKLSVHSKMILQMWLRSVPIKQLWQRGQEKDKGDQEEMVSDEAREIQFFADTHSIRGFFSATKSNYGPSNRASGL